MERSHMRSEGHGRGMTSQRGATLLQPTDFCQGPSRVACCRLTAAVLTPSIALMGGRGRPKAPLRRSHAMFQFTRLFLAAALVFSVSPAWAAPFSFTTG